MIEREYQKPDNQAKSQQVSDKLTDLPTDKKEILQKWIEKGDDGESICVYATSVNVLKNILASGEIQPISVTDESIGYQKEFRNQGYLIYYATPFPYRLPEEMQKVKDEIIGSYSQSVREEYAEGQILYLTDDHMKGNAQHYAAYHAIEHEFSQRTGIAAELPTVLQAAINTNPELMVTFRQAHPNTYYSVESEEIIAEMAENGKLEEIKNVFLNRDELERELKEILVQKGVFIYFDKKVLEQAKVVNGIESESEIMLLSAKPLTLEVISGIEFQE